MRSEWGGRYRSMIQALVQHSNVISRYARIKGEIAPGVWLSAQEWQVLEYLIEHEDETENMLYVSERLGIAQSSLSKYTKTLCSEKLVERYRIKGNKKSIILKATQRGFEVYDYRSSHVNLELFAPLFKELESVPDEMIEQVAGAITALNLSMWRGQREELIPMDTDE